MLGDVQILKFHGFVSSNSALDFLGLIYESSKLIVVIFDHLFLPVLFFLHFFLQLKGFEQIDLFFEEVIYEQLD